MRTTEMVAEILGAGIYSVPLESCCATWGVVTAEQKSFFLGQIFVESQGFKRVVENLNYSEARLLSVFGRHRITAADAKKYAHQPEQIANRIYGGEWGRQYLGNLAPDDGWRYRGRGLKQITGRANYLSCSMGLFGDDRLLQRPDLLEQLPWCVESAGWYWNYRKINAVVPDIVEVTKKVNGGTNGLQERREATDRALKLFSE